jgi:N-acetylglutamate synthase-like GNAT family acetyltransferase
LKATYKKEKKREGIMFILRRYENNDFEQVRHLRTISRQQVWESTKDDDIQDEDLQGVDQIYFENDGEFLIGELNGHIIAMGAFKKSAYEMAEIDMLWIHPHFQKQEYGKIIISELEKKAQELGYKGLYLAFQEMHIGKERKLYRQCGFNEIIRVDQEGLDYIILEKRF